MGMMRRSVVRWGLVCLLPIGLAVWWAWRQWPSAVPPDDVLQAAITSINRKDYASARQQLDELLKAYPNFGKARLYRGQLFRDQGEREAALRDWQRIPDSPARVGGTARYLEAMVFLDRRQLKTTEHLLQRAIALNPTYRRPRDQLLKLYAMQRRTDNMRETLDGLRSLGGWTLEECALQVLAGQDVRPAAAEFLQECVEADPQDVHSRLALCRYWIESGQTGRAIYELRKLLRDAPTDRDVAALLISAMLDEGRVSDAEELLQIFPLQRGAPSSLWFEAGRQARLTQNWKRALVCFQQAGDQNPYNVSARYSLGTILARIGRPEEAERAAQAAALLDGVERKAFLMLRGSDRDPKLLAATAVEIAELLVDLQLHEDAFQWFHQALVRTPENPRARAGYQHCIEYLRASNDSSLSATDSPAPAPLTPLRSGEAACFNGENSARSPAVEVSGRLRDAASEAGIDFQYFNGQSGLKYIVETIGGGVAVLDDDLDGWPDLYFPQGAPLDGGAKIGPFQDRLYRNQNGRRFHDVTEAARLGDTRYSLGAAVGDYNHDGFPDLFVANFGTNVLYRNNGDGTFRDVTEAAGLDDSALSSSAAFADFDNDGLLDLYVVNYVADPLRICRNAHGEIATCDPQNFDGEQDRLYVNAGDGTFLDVTERAGIKAAGGKGLGIVVADFDGDARSDIYVANDGTPNFLFRNVSTPKGGLAFIEVGLTSGAAMNGEGRSEAGMGIACADFNRDGRPDLYVTNFYHETNTLYLNQGNGFFIDATDRSGLARPTLNVLGFGTQALDVNMDGWPDLVVANGDIDDYRAFGRPWKMKPQLFMNLKGKAFDHAGKRAGSYFTGEYLGRGMARLDFNRDGLPDLVVVHFDRPAALLMNETPDPGHKLVLQLKGIRSNRDAVGALVHVTGGGRTQTVPVCGGDGYCAANERRLLVGLGRATSVERLRIEWPSGRRDQWEDLDVDGELLLVEGQRPLRMQAGRRLSGKEKQVHN